MSEVVQQPPPAEQPLPAGEDKRVWAERVLSDILRLMALPAKLDFKDAEDGSLSVAVKFEAEVPGVAAGKRSQLMDALQFLVNKVVNRPGLERRWVNLGAYEHPAPRGAKKEPAPKAAAPALAPEKPKAQKGKKAAPVAPGSTPAAPSVDERTLEVAEDAALTRAARSLMDKSGKLGRFYALFAMETEDRARTVQAVKDVEGAKVRVEGEGRMRRVVLVPDNPTPMPKRTLPDYGDDEEDED